MLRDRFFPGQPIVTTLEHVEAVGGKVTRRTTLVSGGKKARETPHYARFHVTEDGTLWVVELVTGIRPDGSSLHENRIFALRPGEDKITSIPLPLKTPFSTFFTAAERGGSRPSNCSISSVSGRTEKRSSMLGYICPSLALNERIAFSTMKVAKARFMWSWIHADTRLVKD